MIRQTSIRQKIFLLLFAINLLTTVTYTYTSYRSESTALLEGIDKQLEGGAVAVPLILPPDYHDRITGPDSIPEAEYLEYLRRLSELADKTGLKYLYTYMLVGGEVATTASNATAEERREGSYARFFQPYDAPPALRASLADGQRRFAEVHDEWGHVRSLFIPASTARGTSYVMGADIDIEFVRSRLRRTLLQCLAIGAAIFLLVSVMSLYLGNRLAQGILQLARYAENLAESEFLGSDALRREIDALCRRTRDEVGRLAQSFVFMERKLAEYLVTLRSTTAAKERIETEMKLAGDIQMSLLPRLDSFGADAAGGDLHAYLKTARQAGGDLYDVFELEGRRLCLAVGDVSDKGMPAALFMAVTITLLRSLAARHQTLEATFEALNDQLSANNDLMQFVTLAGFLLDRDSGELSYCDGGHNPPYLLRANAGIELLPRQLNMALGAMAGIPYAGSRLRLAPGDVVFAYTDGLTEAWSEQREQYGQARLEARLAALPRGLSCERIIAIMREDVAAFCGSEPLADDLTLLVFRYLGPAAEPGVTVATAAAGTTA